VAQDNELPIKIIIDPTGAKSGSDQVVRSIDDIPKRAKGGLQALQKSINDAVNFDGIKDGGTVFNRVMQDILQTGKKTAQRAYQGRTNRKRPILCYVEGCLRRG